MTGQGYTARRSTLTDRVSALPYLVGDAQALIDNWERAPFVSTPPRDLNSVFSLETVEALLLSGALPLPCVRLFRDGGPIPADGFGRPAERGAAKRDRLTDPAAVLSEVAAGATLLVEELQTYCRPLAELTSSLSDESGYSTYCAAFLTPADAPGVNPHFDTASVFIRQLDGSKIWRVGEPVTRWPAGGWSATTDVRTPTVLEVELKAGECLYIPRGFVHSGIATSHASVHLSVGMNPPTWAAVLRPLVNGALSEEPFREALPYAFHALAPQEQRRLLTERMTALTAQLGQLAENTSPAAAMAKAVARRPAKSPAAGSLRSALTGSR
jgi:bifunctional lysine-specific demethylase and histidyl-hydroxylase NO66